MDWYGSDVLVELLAAHGIEHVAFNPGASFRGLQDSLVFRADGPGIVLTADEGIAVAIAHGYAKATGRPMAVALHDIVGLQRGAMGIFNAWCDRVPMLVLGGTGPVAKTDRRPWIDWIHTALVQGNQVRDYVKWDDQPATVADVPESFIRGLRAACSAPAGPVYLCYDAGLQEQLLEGPPGLDAGDDYPLPTPPAPEEGDLAWLAERCAAARLPVLVSDYAGDTPAGFQALVDLAELLHAPVLDGGARLCFPTDHPLNATGAPEILDEADVVVAIDVEDLFGTLRGHVYETTGHTVAKSRPVTVVHFTPAHYKLRAWSSDYQRLAPLDRLVSATAETALAGLLAACRKRPPAGDRLVARRERLDGAREQQRRGWWAEAVAMEHPTAVQPARLAAELWEVLRDESWVLANGSLSGWERRLWDFRRARQHLGWHGGGGLGYGLGASIGAALALGSQALCVDLQPDGDFLFTPSALWTLAHYRLPLLIVMHNNRQYGNTVDHAERIAAERGRPVDKYAATTLDDPAVDYAAVARGYGLWAAGPVTRARDLPQVLAEAVGVVRSGRPALVDVVTVGS